MTSYIPIDDKPLSTLHVLVSPLWGESSPSTSAAYVSPQRIPHQRPQITIILPARPLLAVERERLQFLVALLRLRLHQPVRQPAVRQHGAEEGDQFVVLDQQGREVLDVQVPHHIRVILDVDPDEELVWMARGQFLERGAVRFARAAPGRAQARDDPAVAGQGGRDLLAIGGI